MIVVVHFTDGKRETFHNVEDVRNQERDYRLPRSESSAATILIPKASVKWLEIKS